MSDNDSFVILNSCPGSEGSSLSCAELESQYESRRTVDDSHQQALAVVAPTTKEDIVVTNEPQETNDVGVVRDSGSNSQSSSTKSSLAASFIMGEVNADVLKNSVYTQFPAICSTKSCQEELQKLQSFMSDYVEIKSTLASMSLVMKKFYQKNQVWREESRNMERNYNVQLQQFQEQITMLRDDNKKLKSDISSKMERMRMMDKVRQSECDEMTHEMGSIRTTIDKLSEQQLMSQDMIRHQGDENSSKDKGFVDRLEYEECIKGLQSQLSELLAKNIDLEGMEKRYIDELNCLKVNLTAAEELIQNHQAELEELRQLRLEHHEMKEEMQVLRHQLDIFRQDFELERNSRQKLAGEKDQLLNDLRAFQKNNQVLIDELQKQYESAKQREYIATPRNGGNDENEKKTSLSSSSSSSSSSVVVVAATDAAMTEKEPKPHSKLIRFCCPVCSTVYPSYADLSGHIDACLNSM